MREMGKGRMSSGIWYNNPQDTIVVGVALMKPSIALRGKREQILAIAAQYGAYNVRIFGSVARGEDTEHSDLDLLIDMDADRPLSDLGLFAEDVHDALQCEVDAVTSTSLHRLLSKRILRDAVPL